jgi:type I restriction enzyme, S subunit
MIEQVAIGDCCQIINGSTPSRNTPEYWDGDIDWFTPKDLSKLGSKYIDEAPEKITERGYESCSTTMIPAYSILFTSRAPIGHIAINQRPVCTNQGFKSLVPSESVDINYLYYVVKKYTPNLQDLGNGATFKELSKATVSAFKLPLPPLEEQKQIAAILDAADELRQKDKALIAKYDELTQSLFLDMFGDPVTNPMGWVEIPFNELVSNITAGVSVGGENRTLNRGENGVLKISAVTSGTFKGNEYKVVDNDSLPTRLIRPLRGDLIFSRANTREMVGAVAIVDQDYEHLFLPDKLWRIDLIEGVGSVYYVQYLLSHEGFRNNLRSVATGTSGSMLNISKAKLLALKIPSPNKTLKNQFAKQVQAIESQKVIVQDSLNKSEDLFNSLLQKAFKGELTN